MHHNHSSAQPESSKHSSMNAWKLTGIIISSLKSGKTDLLEKCLDLMERHRALEKGLRLSVTPHLKARRVKECSEGRSQH